MNDDLENSEEFKQWKKHQEENVFPNIQDSSIFVSIVPTDRIDAKAAVEIGAAVLLDKPIIGLIRPGTKISEKFARVVDRFVEFDPESQDFSAIRTAVEEMIEEQNKNKND